MTDQRLFNQTTRMIKHIDPRYGYFVGWRNIEDSLSEFTTGYAFQPDYQKAVRAWRFFVDCRPSFDVEQALQSLNHVKHLHDKLYIIDIS